jgi:hypothetical protein
MRIGSFGLNARHIACIIGRVVDRTARRVHLPIAE